MVKQTARKWEYLVESDSAYLPENDADRWFETQFGYPGEDGWEMVSADLEASNDSHGHYKAWYRAVFKRPITEEE